MPQEFIASDPWIYSKIAHGIAENFDFGSNSIFNQRLGVVIPVAISYSLFDVNILSTNLCSLIATLTIIIIVWIALPDAKSKIISLVLSLISVPLWKYSSSLYPDIIATSFMAGSTLILMRRDHHNSIIIGIIGVLSLFLGFLAKELAYWVLPLWVFALYEDVRNRTFYKKWKTFYLPAFMSALILCIFYLVFCYIIWDDPLAHFKAVQ